MLNFISVLSVWAVPPHCTHPNNSACTEGAVCIIVSHCIIVHTWGGGTAPLVLAGVNIKHYGLLALWGLRLTEPTGPTEQVICITPWPGWPFTYMYTYLYTVFMMNTIRDGCGRFNHSLCKQFLVGNCWLNEYMCEGGGGRTVNSIV